VEKDIVMDGSNDTGVKGRPSWQQVVMKYNFPDTGRSIWQLVNSVIPLLGIFVLMYLSLDISYLLTLALAVLASGFMVRVFIIFHDCGHRSFFKSERANQITGFFTGLFTLTGFVKWQRSHNAHHATVGNLDKRGEGDVMTMTREEYENASKRKKLFYRLYRNPLIMLGIGAPYIFIIQNRFFSKRSGKNEKWNIVFTNIVLAIIIAGISLLIGFKAFLMIYLPVLYISSILGTWLFYMQHQFEGVHWYRQGDWDYPTVALKGSSYYKLPGLLKWFSGNIGFHHVHHLSPRIPNYKLEECNNDNPIFSDISPVKIKESLRSLKLRLWDEEQGKLVGF
jgi:omega-6 fatty acid desaturase (delta-12 desaturase)